ncbi:MAG: tetratricopeptide repeat protein, partial [Gemmatimonadetes bacterium]|nr:tetratricopeptide repeat protein [Gemmatimonadota bacterium]
RDEEAAQAYRDYLGREPGNLTAKINLAVVLIRQGKAAEASQTYTELLAQPDLSADEYFRIGVGLFRAEDYPRAGEAFRKALQLNPHHRDSYYNLAQTLYVRTSPLEDARAKAKGDELKKVNAELGPLYGEVRQLAEKLREYDPANRNVLALLARAYRGLGDAAADVKTGDQWKLKAVGVLTLYQEMPFEVVELSLSGAEGEVALKGTLQNLKLKQGEPIKLRLSLLGATGAAVATQEVTVPAPAAEETTTFEAKAKVQEGVAGWKYEVLP